jgi:hypothetical protein
MKRTFNCLICNKEKTVRESKKRSGTSKYCSTYCCYSFSIEKLKFIFNKKAIKNNECWGWIGSLLSGRGQLYYKGKSIQAHRASWLIYKGEIPEDKWVLHKCDNGICSNPEHLFLGTPADNVIDMIKKDRSPLSILNHEKVIAIRNMINCGVMGKIIAKQFNISPHTVSDIKLNKTWRHI